MIAKSEMIVALGPAKPGGERPVRVVVDARDKLPENLPQDFVTITIPVGAQIPDRSQSYNVVTRSFAVDSDREDGERARELFHDLFIAWKRLEDLKAFRLAYPKVEVSDLIDEARADLAAIEARLPASRRPPQTPVTP